MKRVACRFCPVSQYNPNITPIVTLYNMVVSIFFSIIPILPKGKSNPGTSLAHLDVPCSDHVTSEPDAEGP